MEGARTSLLVALLAACSAPPPPPVAVRPPVAPPPADVDAEDCRSTQPGRLFTRWGAFWFDASRGAEPAEGDGEARAPRPTSETLVVPSAETASEHVEHERALAPEGSAAVPWYGTLVPLADSTFGVAVRSYTARPGADRAPAPTDALVKIEPRSLTPEVIYASGHRLHMVGRLFGAILFAELVRDGHQLVAVDGNGREIARSRAVVFPPGAVDDRLTELPLRTVAPLDLRRLVITGERDHVFMVEIRGQTIELADTGAVAEQGLGRRADGTLLFARRGGLCALPGRLPPTRWRALRVVRCPRDSGAFRAEGVPVDGQLVHGVRGDAQRCRVRSAVALPALPGDASAQGSGVAVLSDRSVTGERLDMDLLVRGRHLSVGFEPAEGAGAVPSGFGVALPAGAVEARETHADGAKLWRVRLQARAPLRAPPACLQGRWVVRAWSDEGEGEDASATRYDEFGVCD